MLSAMSFNDQLRKPRTWFIAVPVVILLAVVVGPFVYFNVIQDDAPARASVDDLKTPTTDDGATTETTDGSGDTTAPSDSATIDGSWEVADGTGSFAGYRATEVLFGQSNDRVRPALVEELVAELVLEFDEANRSLLGVTRLLSEWATPSWTRSGRSVSRRKRSRSESAWFISSGGGGTKTASSRVFPPSHTGLLRTSPGRPGASSARRRGCQIIWLSGHLVTR